MKASTFLSLLAFLALLLFLPLFFAQVMAASLLKLHLAPGAALLIVVAIFGGSALNIPIKRIRRDEMIGAHPLAIFGLHDFWPEMWRLRRETIVAVNLGGCVIPVCLAVYELLRVAEPGGGSLLAALVASAVNVVVCYRAARPVPGIGILLPGLVPACVAALMGFGIGGDQAAPVAFIAGVAGPLVGADLLHLREIERTAVGVASIGGAGTFDGIVLSGILAAYLA